MQADRESDKPYAQRKSELAKAFYKVANCPEYMNKTYRGPDFRRALLAWEDAWEALIYKSAELTFDAAKDTSGLAYKARKWMCWSHNFNHILGVIHSYEEKNIFVAFSHPEFLEGMFDVTSRFITARTREAELEALDVTYEIVYVGGKNKEGTFAAYETEKRIWLTEEKLGIRSDALPQYAPSDLTRYMRGRKLYDWYRKNYENSTVVDIARCLAREKENWRCYRRAVSKGILTDNWGKK